VIATGHAHVRRADETFRLRESSERRDRFYQLIETWITTTASLYFARRPLVFDIVDGSLKATVVGYWSLPIESRSATAELHRRARHPEDG
jgi:hypothetical protein